jgi:hypothetical protein
MREGAEHGVNPEYSGWSTQREIVEIYEYFL